jgi:uncharacterized protein YceK
MKLAALSLTILALPLIGCATTVSGTTAGKAPASEEAAAKAEEKDREKEELARKLDLARARFKVTALEAQAFDAKHEARVRHATVEVEMAKAKLATFREVDVPNRVATQTLNLQSTRDRAQEAADELAQIEIMYAEQDLDDQTREFVIQRGRRNAERSAKRIEIQEGEFRKMKERELPQEERKLELSLDKANTGLTAADREGEIGRQQKAIAVKQAENEVHKLELELKKQSEASSEESEK